MIEINVRIRVRLAPRIASTRKNGARRTIDPAKDLHAMTQDQSPASALQLFPRNFTTQMLRRTETASRFAAPRMRRHFGCDFASGFKKRTHAIPSRTGGENTEKTLRIVSNHNPCMIGEYASKALGSAGLLRAAGEVQKPDIFVLGPTSPVRALIRTWRGEMEILIPIQGGHN